MNKILILLIFYSSSLQAKPLVVYLDWFLNPHHAPLVVALQQGFFKQHGLEVELVAAGGSEEGSKQVASGRADIAVSKLKLVQQLDASLIILSDGAETRYRIMLKNQGPFFLQGMGEEPFLFFQRYQWPYIISHHIRHADMK